MRTYTVWSVPSALLVFVALGGVPEGTTNIRTDPRQDPDLVL